MVITTDKIREDKDKKFSFFFVWLNSFKILTADKKKIVFYTREPE